MTEMGGDLYSVSSDAFPNVASPRRPKASWRRIPANSNSQHGCKVWQQKQAANTNSSGHGFQLMCEPDDSGCRNYNETNDKSTTTLFVNGFRGCKTGFAKRNSIYILSCISSVPKKKSNAGKRAISKVSRVPRRRYSVIHCRGS